MQISSSIRVPKLNPWMLSILIIATLGTMTTVYLKTQKTSSKPDLTSQTVLVQTQNLVVQIQATGVVQAIKRINLSPEESGRIALMYVQEGDRVLEGQMIASMSNGGLQAQVNQYRALREKAINDLNLKRAGTRNEEIAEINARVKIAKSNLAAAQTKLNRASVEMERNQIPAEKGAISRYYLEGLIAKFEEAKANKDAELAKLKEQEEILNKALNGPRLEEIAQAEAEVASASSQLDYYQHQLNNTFIKAPFAGVITRRFAQEGDFITPTTSASTSEGATSTSIAELSSGLEIEAKIPEASISKINPNQTVDIYTDTYPNSTFKGIVRSIAPRAVLENNITFFRVKVALNEQETKLKLGMNVKLTFNSQPTPDALVIPLASVVTKPDGQTGVYVYEEKEARFRVIKVSAVSGIQVQVLEGLKAGERVFIYPPETEQIEGF